jgi:hypothetical protein
MPASGEAPVRARYGAALPVPMQRHSRTNRDAVVFLLGILFGILLTILLRIIF